MQECCYRFRGGTVATHEAASEWQHSCIEGMLVTGNKAPSPAQIQCKAPQRSPRVAPPKIVTIRGLCDVCVFRAGVLVPGVVRLDRDHVSAGDTLGGGGGSRGALS